MEHSAYDWFKTISAILLGLFTILALFTWARRPKNLPPGPWSWPIIGGLPTVAIMSARYEGLLHEAMEELAMKYGKIFSVRMGSKLMVVLSDYQIIRDTFQGPDVVDRPQRAVKTVSTPDDPVQDIVFGSGPAWKEQRKFFLSIFRGFGVGKLSFEKHIAIEASAVIEEFRQKSGQPFYPKQLLANATANVICTVLFGKRYQYNDSEFKMLYEMVTESMRIQSSGGVERAFPIIHYFRNQANRRVTELMLGLHTIFQRIIEEHKAKLEANNEKMENDSIDAYLLEMKEERLNRKTRYYTDNNLLCNITNMFIAGMETSANTLTWCLLYMAAYPEIQQRLQKEIDNAVGTERMASLADKRSLPNVEATLLEVQRIRPVAPMGAPHSNPKETTICGYTIPEGTIVTSNIWAILHDHNVWDKPDEFRPERFLKEQDGYFEVCRQDDVLTFSIGRRMCAGEKIAKTELFIIFTHLLQIFTFALPDNAPVNFRPRSAFSLEPQYYEIHAYPRNKAKAP